MWANAMPATMPSGSNVNNPDSLGLSEIDVSSRTTSQTRKQRARTYGKRSAQSREPDAPPLAKKRKTEDATATIVSPPRLLELPQPEPPIRGSILSYFKPIRSSSSLPPPDPPVSEPSLTPPPSSPTLPLGTRKRRRLTTRPDIPDCEVSAARRHQRDAARGGKMNKGVLDEDNDAPQSCRAESSEHHGVLEEVALNVLNQTASSFGATVKQYSREKKKKPIRGRSTKDMVQTTLSLGINPGPGYTVCRDCGMLYNPLNEKDRVDHRRQHAAYVRGKSKAKLVG